MSGPCQSHSEGVVPGWPLGACPSSRAATRMLAQQEAGCGAQRRGVFGGNLAGEMEVPSGAGARGEEKGGIQD